MIIRPITDYAAFHKLAVPALGVFGSEKWLSIYDDTLQVMGIFKDEHQLIGGFYYLDTRVFGQRFIKLPPYSPHCGLFFASDGTNPSSINSHRKEVMENVCAYFISLKSALCILAFPVEQIDFQPFIWSAFKVIPNYTYRIALDQSLEQIQSNFSSKHRNMINKALKENLEIKANDLSPDQLFQFFTSSLEHAGANIYEGPLRKLFQKFDQSSNSFSFSAHHGTELVGVVYCINDHRTCYYLLGGISRGAGNNGLNNLLILRCIEKAKNLSCQVFDFEGSMLVGVEKFFRGFGPELFPYFTVNKAWKPIEMALKFKKPELF